MKKSEIKKVIEIAAAAIENGGYALSLPLTAIIYSGKIPFDFEDGNETYENENGEEVTKRGVFVSKDENGEVSVIVDNFACYPPTYTVDEFAKEYGEYEEFEDSFEKIRKIFAENPTEKFAEDLINKYYPDEEEELREFLIEELIG